jgi:hypothetical protein
MTLHERALGVRIPEVHGPGAGSREAVRDSEGGVAEDPDPRAGSQRFDVDGQGLVRVNAKRVRIHGG